MLEAMHKSAHSFGMFLTNANTYYSLVFNGSKIETDIPECLKDLDVTVLHKLIFERLLKIEHYEYEMDLILQWKGPERVCLRQFFS